MEKRIPLDDQIVNMTYYSITMAQICANTLIKAVRQLRLDSELDKEQKMALKRDLEWTQSAVMALDQAGKHYRWMVKCLDSIDLGFTKKIHDGLYDEANGNANELLALDIMYLAQTDMDPETTNKILHFMTEVKEPDKDTAQLYMRLLQRANKIRG